MEYDFIVMREFADSFDSCESERCCLQLKKQKLASELQLVQANLKHSSFDKLRIWLKPLLCGALIASFVFILVLVVFAVFFNIFNICVLLFFGNSMKNNDSIFSSRFGRVGAIIQVSLVHFLLITSLWGFYFSHSFAPRIRLLRPKARRTSADQVLANLTFLLLITSALPLQSAFLGFTAVTPLENSVLAPIFTPYKNAELAVRTPIETSSEKSLTRLIFSKPTSILTSIMITPDEPTFRHEEAVKNGTAEIIRAFLGRILPMLQNKEDKPTQDKCSKQSGETVTISLSWIYRMLMGENSVSRQCPVISGMSTAATLLVLLCYNVAFLLSSYFITGPRLKQASALLWADIRKLSNNQNPSN
ncbi:NAD kinase domain containing 1 [Cichlidogyrus casuarinus]|uniref:NAD kinase domain containing 1 n=1 Tax=Cichlidogyrus casuarinus TaxID=1844966 RepID=A0ABD2QNL7_9PLAT